MAKQIFAYLGPRALTLRALGSDSTNINIGWKGGANHFLEVMVGRPLQYITCTMHLNELPLRHLLDAFDGDTTSPDERSGKIGKLLVSKEIHLNSIKAGFEPVQTSHLSKFYAFLMKKEARRQQNNTNLRQGEEEEEDELREEEEEDSLEEEEEEEENSRENSDDKVNLTSDQSHLVELSIVVATGQITNPRVLTRAIGKMHNARWITTASRILRLWLSNHNLDNDSLEVLRWLVTYVVQVFVPVMIDIKTKPKCSFGSIHYHAIASRSRVLPPKMRDTVLKVLKTNFFWAHPENILISMFDDPSMKSESIKIITEIRQKNLNYQAYSRKSLNNNLIRYFKRPNFINFDAEYYYQLIDFTKESLTEPPLTMNYNLNHLQIPKIPCHAQKTENLVGAVSKSTSKNVDERRQLIDPILIAAKKSNLAGPKDKLFD